MAIAFPMLDFLTPDAPSVALALTTTTADVTLPVMKNEGLAVLLHNRSAVVVFVNFGATASATTGYAIEPNTEVGPFRVPIGETALSALTASSTGTLGITYVTAR